MDKIIAICDKKFTPFISQEEIAKAAQNVANEINKEYANDIPVIFVTLNGALLFAAEVIKRLTITCEISGVKFASYHGGTSSTGSVQDLIGFPENLEGRRILIIEDIVDTGNTYEHMLEILHPHHPQDVKIATMTFKPDSYKKDLPIDFIGMKIPNKFIVGFGLDYNGLGRNYPAIYELYQE